MKIIGSKELLNKAIEEVSEDYGVKYDESNNTIVFTHMYQVENDEGKLESVYDINLDEFTTPNNVLKELESLCEKPQIEKVHIKEFVRLSLAVLSKK